MRKLAVLLLAVMVLAGCSPLERQAYNTVVGAKAFIDAEKKMHPECASGSASTLCSSLNQATAAKDALITAAEVYCAGPSFEAGGACSPPAKGTPAAIQAADKLKAAIASYNQLANEIKAAAGK